MFKLWYTIVKDWRILTRDKVGLALMFIMPVLLVFVITSVQLSTFEMVNENKVPLVVNNLDQGLASKQLLEAIQKVGIFELTETTKKLSEKDLHSFMHQQDALLAITIPDNFSEKIAQKARDINEQALNDFGLVQENATPVAVSVDPLTLYYNPVLQDSYRNSIRGAIQSALQIVESKQILQTLYYSLNKTELPKALEDQIINNKIDINEIPVSRDGNRTIPNATQHNIPAWTIFAMFFIVTSLGSNVVKEKLSGSFIRLKTLPTNYLTALFSKKIAYMAVCMGQVVVIFSIGVWIFPLIGLPALDLPSDILGLIVVSLISAWCAISYAICVGVFANTQEQANGFGAVSVVILAAIGGILIPSFAMPDSFQLIMKISPLHWALESYYGLFLEGGKFKDVWISVIPLIVITISILLVALLGLKKKHLI